MAGRSLWGMWCGVRAEGRALREDGLIMRSVVRCPCWRVRPQRGWSHYEVCGAVSVLKGAPSERMVSLWGLWCGVRAEGRALREDGLIMRSVVRCPCCRARPQRGWSHYEVCGAVSVLQGAPSERMVSLWGLWCGVRAAGRALREDGLIMRSVVRCPCCRARPQRGWSHYEVCGAVSVLKGAPSERMVSLWGLWCGVRAEGRALREDGLIMRSLVRCPCWRARPQRGWSHYEVCGAVSVLKGAPSERMVSLWGLWCGVRAAGRALREDGLIMRSVVRCPCWRARPQRGWSHYEVCGAVSVLQGAPSERMVSLWGLWCGVRAEGRALREDGLIMRSVVRCPCCRARPQRGWSHYEVCGAVSVLQGAPSERMVSLWGLWCGVRAEGRALREDGLIMRSVVRCPCWRARPQRGWSHYEVSGAVSVLQGAPSERMVSLWGLWCGVRAAGRALREDGLIMRSVVRCPCCRARPQRGWSHYEVSGAVSVLQGAPSERMVSLWGLWCGVRAEGRALREDGLIMRSVVRCPCCRARPQRGWSHYEVSGAVSVLQGAPSERMVSLWGVWCGVRAEGRALREDGLIMRSVVRCPCCRARPQREWSHYVGAPSERMVSLWGLWCGVRAAGRALREDGLIMRSVVRCPCCRARPQRGWSHYEVCGAVSVLQGAPSERMVSLWGLWCGVRAEGRALREDGLIMRSLVRCPCWRARPQRGWSHYEVCGAVSVLKGAPSERMDTVRYQITLTLYQASGQGTK